MLPDERMVEAAWMSSEAPSMTHAEARAMTEAAFAALDRDALIERATTALVEQRAIYSSRSPITGRQAALWRGDCAEAVLRAVGLIA